MRHTPAGETVQQRWRRAIVTAGVLVLVIGIGTYAALGATSSTSSQEPSHQRSISPSGTSASPTRPSSGSPPPQTADPKRFARFVAYALFDWDTARGRDRYFGRLVDVADPAGEESPGLVADMANYLPPATTWVQLRRYGTRQRIEIDSIETPLTWASATADVRPGQLLPGTTAYTIRGTRHRVGIWRSERVASARDIEFTVFVVCRPSYPRCHLLRLSLPNRPLQ